MKNIFLVPRGQRAFYQKLLAGFLTLSMNLSVGGLGIFLMPQAAYADVVPPVTIFSDGLESSTLSGWVADTDWHEGANDNRPGSLGTKSAFVKTDTNGTSTLRHSESTVGYTGVTLDYWYRVTDNLDSSDLFVAQWSNDGATWTDVAGTALKGVDKGNWVNKIVTLPSGADNNGSFAFRFAAKLTKGSHNDKDEVRIDDVSLTGTRITYTLTTSTVGNGKIEGTGVSCGMGGSDCSETYSHGTAVTLTETPDAGNEFVGWGGACAGTATTCSLTMDSAKEVSASFRATVVPPPQSCEENTSRETIISNTTNTTAPETPAVAAWVHPAWTASTTMPNSIWIWNAVVANDVNDEAVTFTKTFTVTGTPTTGSIVIAADNTYEASLNGTEFGSSSAEDNYSLGNQDTYDVSSLLQSGSNTLTITVHNIGTGSRDNPAGLLYALSYTKNACEPTPPVPQCDPSANLLENPGFEDPKILGSEFDNGGWGIVPFAYPALKWLGAFVNPQDGGRLGLELQASVAGAPFAGLQHAELDGDHPTTIWQDVATIPGKEYQLDLKFSPRPSTPLSDNILQILAGGSQLGDQVSLAGTTTQTAWMPVTRTFVATSSVTRVQFADLGADNSFGTYIDDTSLRCVGDPTPKATIIATKVICDNESNLPNWSGTQHVINAETAQAYVDQSDGQCRVDPEWQFQWAPTSAGNPGDNTGAAREPWHTFVSSVVIPLGEMTSVWVREVFDSHYVPFTGTADENKVSAEMYCNGDVLHYDNLDYARGLTDGGTVYCVAFNAPLPK